jgi:two-component system nitrogen regulation response regulator NtrX
VINAAAITPERMEIELFGVDRSNDSEDRKPGALEEADGGTLFLDDVAELPRETQNKILRVLVDQTFQRVGGNSKVAVDVRIMSSTARNLEAEIADGRFREDLYHRLSVVPIRVPPLAERRDDIPDLVEYFMDQISQVTGLPKRRIGEDAMAVLQSHNWPGNVRQLRNNIERLMILAGGDPNAVLNASMLPPDVGSMVPQMPNGNGGEHLMGLPLRDAREVFEREYLVAQISRFGGNISRTAEFVGMERSALHRQSLGRGPRLPVRRWRLRSVRGAGRASDRRAPSHGAARSLAQRTAHRAPDVAGGARDRAARNCAAQPGTRRHRLLADYPRRGEAGFRVSAGWHHALDGGDGAQH